MARVTDDATPIPAASSTDGHAREWPVRPMDSSRAAADPAAVRVRLAPTSAVDAELPVLRVARTKLGPDAAVSAQRHVEVDGQRREVELVHLGQERYLLRDREHEARVVMGHPTRHGDGTIREVLVDGFHFEVEVVSDRRAALRERATRAAAAGGIAGPLDVRAIIPGRVVSVAVAAGDRVVAGQQLLVVEAMKMQNELRAPRDGTIDRVGVTPGVTIDVGDVLVVVS